MALSFGSPHPPRILHPEVFLVGFLVGLGVSLVSTFLIDQLGTAMFKRGFAKPFYIKGRRVHHKFLYYAIPSSYSILSALYFLGVIQPIWGTFYDNLGYAALLVGATLAIDFFGDRFWPKIRKNVILHHEWVYTIVPFFIFTYVVNVVI
jgi:hypothetical protein